jgi:hypothetical protein
VRPRTRPMLAPGSDVRALAVPNTFFSGGYLILSLDDLWIRSALQYLNQSAKVCIFKFKSFL